jgi:protein involved in sex pheromone biosynthesis
MKRIMILLLAAILFLTACNTEEEEATEDNAGDDEAQTEEAVQNESGADEEIVAVAEEFIGNLSEGEYEEAAGITDETFEEQADAGQLQDIWQSLENQLGKFVDYEYNKTEVVDEYDVVLINGVFNDADVTFQVTVSENQKVAGFYIY